MIRSNRTTNYEKGRLRDPVGERKEMGNMVALILWELASWAARGRRATYGQLEERAME